MFPINRGTCFRSKLTSIDGKDGFRHSYCTAPAEPERLLRAHATLDMHRRRELTGALSDRTRGRARMRSVPVPYALTAAPFPLLISTTCMCSGLANALLIEVLGRARPGPATDDVSLNLRRGYDDCVEVVAQEQTTAWFTPDILFHMSALSTTWSHRGCLANWQARARTLFGVL